MNPPELVPRSKLAIGFLGLCVLAAVVALWNANEQLGVINRVLAGERVSLTEARSVVNHGMATIGLTLIAYVPAIIAFLLWFSRAYRSIPALTGGERYKPRDAVLSWFIPFLSLVRPKQAMNDLWRAGDPELPRNTSKETLGSRPVNPLVHWWWATWLLSGVVLRFATSAGNNAPTLAAKLHSELTAEMIGNVLAIVSAVMAILVVRSTTERLEARRGVSTVPALVPDAVPFAPPEPPRDVSQSMAPPGF